MKPEGLLARISVDPNVCFGKPCIRGHRIWVSLILDLLASGSSFEDVLRSYPGLEEADIRACIAYGAEMSRERYVPLPIEKSGSTTSGWRKVSASEVHAAIHVTGRRRRVTCGERLASRHETLLGFQIHASNLRLDVRPSLLARFLAHVLRTSGCSGLKNG